MVYSDLRKIQLSKNEKDTINNYADQVGLQQGIMNLMQFVGLIIMYLIRIK